MKLCVDIGNTRIKYGIFDQDKMVHSAQVNKWLVRDIKALQKAFPIDRCILSSTRKNRLPFYNYLEKQLNLHHLTARSHLPFDNKYKTPKTLGKDRVAAVAGAKQLYPGKHCLVVDIGTCMTLDFIDNRGAYLGGNIAPGMHLRLEIMHTGTSALPLVKADFNDEVLGGSTIEALQNGAIYGILTEIEGLSRRLEAKYGAINVILTGGDASRFGEMLECKKFVVPELVLIGLNAILEYND